MNTTEIRKVLRANFPKAGYSSKKKGLIFKAGYYWRPEGGSRKYSQGKLETVQKFFDDNNIKATATIIDHSDHWNAWPKDSWLEVVIGFTVNEVVPVVA